MQIFADFITRNKSSKRFIKLFKVHLEKTSSLSLSFFKSHLNVHHFSGFLLLLLCNLFESV